MPTDLSREPQISSSLHFLECKLPACRPAPRRCCCPAAPAGRCTRLHAAAQKPCACTAPGKGVSQSGRGPCRKEKAKEDLKSPLPLEILPELAKPPGSPSRGSWGLPGSPAAWQREHRHAKGKCQRTFWRSTQAMLIRRDTSLPQANTSMALDREEIQKLARFTLHEKSPPVAPPLLGQLLWPRNRTLKH